MIRCFPPVTVWGYFSSASPMKAVKSIEEHHDCSSRTSQTPGPPGAPKTLRVPASPDRALRLLGALFPVDAAEGERGIEVQVAHGRDLRLLPLLPHWEELGARNSVLSRWPGRNWEGQATPPRVGQPGWRRRSTSRTGGRGPWTRVLGSPKLAIDRKVHETPGVKVVAS